MSRLLIVSNRLPVTVKLDHGEIVVAQSAGGLATGLRGPHQRSESLWLGWPGDVSRLDAGQRSQLNRNLAELRTVPVYLTQGEVSRYYEGFSNEVLWPLFHYLTDKVQRDAWKNWRTYEEVNRRFAEGAAEQYRPGDLVWIHDYQLCLVPALLRQRIPDARIGFFLHIPFPSAEVFRILPWRIEILEGMLGADLVGFHTYSYLKHFRRALHLILGIDAHSEYFHHRDREVRLGVFPMGIDAAAFTRLAEEPSVMKELEAIKKECRDHKLLLGVDRLDYTKGLPRRMLIVDRLLEREPSLRGKIRLIQVVVPSRTKVVSYELYRRRLDEMVGRINAAHATVNSVPIHYLYRSISERQLVSLYRAADVMLVTPLRDGMNLVAKEFVASRVDEDGVLILSEFAGAAAELAEALQVNPYDIDRVASAIKKALTMPEDERRARMQALRRRVLAFDAYQWASSFIGTLQSISREEVAPSQAVSPPEEIEKLLQEVRSAENLLLLLDYDGTLVPFASTPQLAAPDAALKRLLKALVARRGTSAHIVSGRPRDILERWFGSLPIRLHAEHGLWSWQPPERSWEAVGEVSSEWKQKVLRMLEQFTVATPGSLIEEKTAAIAWHYRMADLELGTRQAEALSLRLKEELDGLPVEVLPGDKVIEVRLQGIHKGIIVPRLVDQHPVPRILAMGDDRTDEDLFAALPPGSFAVHVGSGPSRAQYRLADPAAARCFLGRLL